MEPFQSIRLGRWRIKYDPAWSPSRPYCVYLNGTAGPSYDTLSAAKRHFGPQGVTEEWGKPV